jgi:A/G-specific adenine glycosylase
MNSFQKKVLRYYAKNKRDLPWRKTRDPYAILVSEIMLQQTQVERVIPKFVAWLQQFQTIQKLAKASLGDVLKAWSGLGYNNRGKRLHDLAKKVVAEHDGKLPKTVDELETLPGIGPYTARAIIIFSHNADIATIDTNIRRILIYEFKLPENTSSEALQQLAEHCVPKGRSCDWHNALMDYGATHLTARKTGIRPTSRQSKFSGSTRWYRGQIMKMLLQKKRILLPDLKKKLSSHKVDAALEGLQQDGLVQRKGQYIELFNG